VALDLIVETVRGQLAGLLNFFCFFERGSPYVTLASLLPQLPKADITDVHYHSQPSWSSLPFDFVSALLPPQDRCLSSMLTSTCLL
jgi:hypothetical protein